MDLSYLPQFKSVIEDIVKTEIKKSGITNYISAVVQGINNDGTVDVYLPPNRNNLVTKLFNKTGEEINVGDSVEIATKSGSLSNAWIALKHGNTINDEHTQKTNSDYSKYLQNLGRHTEAASNVSGTSPYEGLLGGNSLYLTETYSDSNTPASYGNILSVSGKGSGQLLLEWPGSDTGTGHLYYRSHRDLSSSSWKPWVTILDSDNYSSYALPLSGGTMSGTLTGKLITSNGKQLMSYFTINLSSYSTSNFYPVTFACAEAILDCEIHSPNKNGGEPYNQNVIHYQQMAEGWSDTPRKLNILTYNNYDNSEITIGCIGFGLRSGSDRVVWLRGGQTYKIYSNFTPYLHTSDYTSGSSGSESVFTVGTTYHGGTNTGVEIQFTPQSDIQSGLYFTDSIKTIGSFTANGITSHGQIAADNNITSNGTITGNTLRTSNGYAYVTCSGITLRVGAANSGYIHFQNETNSAPFWFNKDIRVQGDLYGGSSYNRQLAYNDEVGSTVGTSGIWTYIKFNNGYAVCWGVYTFNVVINTTWGNLRNGAAQTPPNFPFTFTTVPTVTMSPTNVNGSTGYMWLVGNNGANNVGPTTTNPGSFTPTRGSGLSTSQAYAVAITAFGKWK